MINIKADDTNSTAVMKMTADGMCCPGNPLSQADIESISLEDCEIISKLGSGGMGAVFLARQLRLDRLVAIKVLKLEDFAKEGIGDALTEEARTMAALNHQNIVGCHDIKFNDKYAFIIMEFVPGETSVKDLVMRCGTLPEYIVLKILIEAISGLMYIHSRGYVHHDLKPANLLVSSEKGIYGRKAFEIFDSADAHIKICDFGIASKCAGKSATDSEGNVLGSPNYMAPEQLTAPEKADFRSDIYALAGTAVYMLTGKPPFDIGNKILLMECKLTNDIPTLLPSSAHISSRFSQILARMGRLDPDERYQSYTSLLNDLQELQERMPTRGTPKYSVRRATFWKRMSLGAFGVILIFCAYYVRSYIENSYFKEKMLSFSNSPMFWSGDIAQWSISRTDSEYGSPIVMSASRVTSPISLKYPILPGQTIEFDVKHIGRGAVAFTLKDDSDLHVRLEWANLDSDKVSAIFTCNGMTFNSIPGIEIPERWHNVSFALLKKGVALFIDGDMVAMATTPFTTRSTMSVQVDSNGSVQLRDVYVYYSRKNLLRMSF